MNGDGLMDGEEMKPGEETKLKLAMGLTEAPRVGPQLPPLNQKRYKKLIIFICIFDQTLNLLAPPSVRCALLWDGVKT